MRLSIAAVLLVLAATLLSAQSRSLTGIVSDQEGHPIAGAVVQMVNMNAAHDVHSCLTKNDGTYRFAVVPFATSYRLQAKVGRYTGNVRHLSEYDWRSSPVINLRIDRDWWKGR